MQTRGRPIGRFFFIKAYLIYRTCRINKGHTVGSALRAVGLAHEVDSLFDLSKNIQPDVPDEISEQPNVPEKVDLLDVCVFEKSNVCSKSELLTWDILSEPLCLYNPVDTVLEQPSRSSSEDDQHQGEIINVPAVLENQFAPQVQTCCDGNCNGDLMYLPSFSFSLHTPGPPFVRMLTTWRFIVALTHADVMDKLFVLPAVATPAQLDSLPSMASTTTANRCISSGGPSIAKFLGVIECLHVKTIWFSI